MFFLVWALQNGNPEAIKLEDIPIRIREKELEKEKIELQRKQEAKELSDKLLAETEKILTEYNKYAEEYSYEKFQLRGEMEEKERPRKISDTGSSLAIFSLVFLVGILLTIYGFSMAPIGNDWFRVDLLIKHPKLFWGFITVSCLTILAQFLDGLLAWIFVPFSYLSEIKARRKKVK